MSLEVLRGQFWRALFVEGQFVSLLLIGLFGVLRLVDAWRRRSLPRVPASMPTMAVDQQQGV
jgi:hypothetical protein